MADPEHVSLLRGGVQTFNRWRKLNPHIRPSLARAELSGLNLNQVNLSFAYLKEAKLRGASLRQADLREADLEAADGSRLSAPGADFSRSNLRQTRLTDADLSGAVFTAANFRKARLAKANLQRAVLSGTRISRSSVDGLDLTNALVYEAAFIDLDFSKTIGLGECRHHGPSVIDRRTLLRSPTLPVEFLRGCGLGDWEIELVRLYNRDLPVNDASDILYRAVSLRASQPIQYFSCFISYSHEDRNFAQLLYNKLQESEYRIRCWLDEKQLRPGDDIYEQIDRGVRLWDKVLLCCSQHSLTSWWCDNEIGIALEKEQKLTKHRGERVNSIIPLNLDGFMFSGNWTSGYRSQITRRFAADFCGWESDPRRFEAATASVVKALRTDDGGREQAPAALL